MLLHVRNAHQHLAEDQDSGLQSLDVELLRLARVDVFIPREDGSAAQDFGLVTPQLRIRLHPIEGEDVYVCGEAWSNVQGWVQGALNTSETLVQKLGLKWPKWLQRGGTWLGPGSNT